jgi:hypothetical protein
MIGRGEIMREILAGLTKPVPDHLQLVGPRFSGKTVILHELVRRMREPSSPYIAVIFWDLGHQTPATDEAFMLRLARELSTALEPHDPAYATHLANPQGDPYHVVAEVLDLLDSEKVLLVMDGFDKPLAYGKLTRNLWDQFRELAGKPSLRLVTASRRKLSDLVRSPDAQTSDFWNIFLDPIRVGCFEENEIADILASSPGGRLSSAAQTAIWSATNGSPLFVLEILNCLPSDARAQEVKADIAILACENAFPRVTAHMEMVWSDCPQSSQDLARRLIKEKIVSRKGIAKSDIGALVENGFARETGDKIQCPSGFLCKFLNDRPDEGNALILLFGDEIAYRENFKEVMARRLAQLKNVDSDLRRYLLRSIEDLPEHPEVFLTNIRGIVDRAFELIWRAELSTKKIPDEWLAIWKHNSKDSVPDAWHSTFPQGGQRLQLLNLMTGNEKNKRCAKYVTKNTHALISAAHTFGNIGQHQEGVSIDLGTAYSALHICIELAASVTRELPQE